MNKIDDLRTPSEISLNEEYSIHQNNKNANSKTEIKVLKEDSQNTTINLDNGNQLKILMNTSVKSKARTMISGLNAWVVDTEEHEFGQELRQRNVLINVLQIINNFRESFGALKFFEDPVLKIVAKDYSSFLLNYSHNKAKLAEFLGYYDYNGQASCFFSKIDIFIDNNSNLNKKKLRKNLEIALLSIMESKDDCLGLLSTSHNAIGVGYALAEECICLVLVTYQAPVMFNLIKENAIGQLIFQGRIMVDNIHIERLSAIENVSGYVIKVLSKLSVRNMKNKYFEIAMDPDFNYSMEKSIIQNEKINYGRVSVQGFLIKLYLGEGQPTLTTEASDSKKSLDEETNDNINKSSISKVSNKEEFTNISAVSGFTINIPLMNFPTGPNKHFKRLFQNIEKRVETGDFNFWGGIDLKNLFHKESKIFPSSNHSSFSSYNIYCCF